MGFSSVQKFYYASEVHYWPAAAAHVAANAHVVARFAQHVQARSLALHDADGESAFAAALRSQHRANRIYRAAARRPRGTLSRHDSSN